MEKDDYALCGLCGERVPVSRAICDKCISFEAGLFSLRDEMERNNALEKFEAIERLRARSKNETLTAEIPRGKSEYCFYCKHYTLEGKCGVCGYERSRFDWCPGFDKRKLKEKFWKLERR